MRIEPTRIAGVFRIETEPIRDDRGFFARLQCPTELKAAGIDFEPGQTSLSRNTASGTLRGMHYVQAPETKLVRCVRGRIFDVAVDLRPDSATRHQWIGMDLDAIQANALLIPPGVAHGFLTLEADSDVLYQIDRLYMPGGDRGVRWDDPVFAIQWPATPTIINERDRGYALVSS